MRWMIAVAVFAATACATAAMGPMSDLVGVYRHTFRSGTFDGDSDQVQDELKIRSLSANRARASLFLNFYNGHSCEIGGVATLEGETLVLPVPIDDTNAPACRLRISHVGDVMEIHDPENACMRQFCGIRGKFEGATLPYASRRGR